MLAIIIIPMYVKAFDFLLSPINYFYDGRLNALCVPLSFLPIFWFQNYDLICMGVHVLLLNIYVAYFVLDPDAQENYA